MHARIYIHLYVGTPIIIDEIIEKAVRVMKYVLYVCMNVCICK